jgi:nucleoside-diphosphate-sugar epimerase
LLQGRRFDAVLDIGNAPTFPEDIGVLLDSVGAHIKRYVFCSTSTVYKRPTTVFPTTEDQPLGTGETEYTRNKLRCENFLMKTYREHGTPITIIRPRHIYGPENYSYREGFFFDRLERGRAILIPGDGSTLTQFGYVEDVAEAFCLALEREKAIGQAYTVTGKECITLDGYIDLLCKVTGKNVPKVHFAPKLLKQFAEPGLYFGESEGVLEDGHTCYDVGKAREHLGYVPKFSLEEGLRVAFKWYQETGGNSYRIRVLDFTFEDELIWLATTGQVDSEENPKQPGTA